jgi:hypothetical protein
MMLKSWNEMRSLDISKYVKKRDGADYLPWSSCLKLLYEHGAERVSINPLVTDSGSSLFMSEQTFTDKNGDTNRCYEVRVSVEIDHNRYFISYPVMNGIAPVRDKLMNQNAVHKAQMRAFVKCVAINTGLGFDLWLDDSDLEEDVDDLTKHNIFAIRERCEILYTNLLKKGMSEMDIAKSMGKDDPNEVKIMFNYFASLHRFEERLRGL